MKPYISILLFSVFGWSQNYPPAAGLPGSTAIHKDSASFVSWATGIEVTRGFVNISNPEQTAIGSNFASAGQPEYAIGFPDGNTVSLGDGGFAVLTFATPIVDGDGFDFAVFENGSAAYLELAFVEASSDGVNFFRFPSHSQTQTDTQIGAFGTPQANYLNNLAGKYEAVYGVPFDLADLPDDVLLDKNHVTHIKVIDAVGSIDPEFASYDSFGNAVNDSFPTPFNSSGFDLQAVGVINQLTLGAGNFDDLKSVFLYPNPAAERVYFSSDLVLDVNISDVSGRVIFTAKNISSDGIDIENLKPGLYHVKAISGNKSAILPLVIK